MKRASKHLSHIKFVGNPSEKRFVEGIIGTMNADGVIIDNKEFREFFDDCMTQYLESKFAYKMEIDRYKCYQYVQNEIDRYVAKKYIKDKTPKYKLNRSKSNTKIINALTKALEDSINRHGFTDQLTVDISQLLDKVLNLGGVVSGE